MKDGFSIDSMKNYISSKETAEYFEEVYSCYINGNYRSAVVMLWSVVIYDVIHKLQTLKDTYNDQHAIRILDEIKTRQKSNSTSSDWELKLIEDVCKNTDLIDFIEYKTLEYLQSQRHLSAHPVLKDNINNLYVPNKDTTRALIRSALEIVFIKPPIYTDKILNSILLDLADVQDIFSSISELTKYVKNKYLERISTESKIKLFEIFWKFVMQKDNKECNDNRDINLKFLIILAHDNLAEIEANIVKKTALYNAIRNDSKFIESLIVFLARVPSVYPLLETGTQMLTEKVIKGNIEIEVASFFNKDSIQEHYEHIKKLFTDKMWTTDISYEAWKILQGASDSTEMEKEFTFTLSLYYNQSGSFDAANKAFENVMRFIKMFNIEAFEYLLEGGEENTQTYKRTQAYKEYKKIKEKIVALEKNFDFTRYPEFNKAAEKLSISHL